MTAPVLPRDTAQVTPRGALGGGRRRRKHDTHAIVGRRQLHGTDTVIAAAPEGPPAHLYAVRGWQVLVGQTDADNDVLSFQVARPDDWWFHVRGMPGSHVILQGPPGADPDRETLQRAAAIAAYHSKARGSGGGLWHTRPGRPQAQRRESGHRADPPRKGIQSAPGAWRLGR